MRLIDPRSLPNGILGCLSIAIALLVHPVTPARAQDNPVSEEWVFQLTPYVWFMSMEGNVTVKGQKSSIDMDFNDIFKQLNVAAMIEGEVRYGRYGLYANVTYAELSDEVHGTLLNLDATVKPLWLGFGAFYRLGPWNLGEVIDGNTATVTVDPYVGGRYTYLDMELDLKPGPNFSGHQDWIDPVVGLRTNVALSERWNFVAFGDVGGFGVGSDFAWQAAGLVGYRFGLFGDNDANVMLGYRALYQDYETGSGTDKFKWDVTLYGPVLALSVQF